MTETLCPEDDLLAGYVEDRLTPPARQLVEVHLAQCPTCLDVVAATLPSSTAPSAAADDHAPSAPVESSRVARRVRGEDRRSARRAAIAAALTLAAAGVGGYAGGRRLMEAMSLRLDAAASVALGMPVRSRGFALRPRSDGAIRVRLSGLTIGDRGSAKALELGIPIAALLAGEPEVRDAVLERPVLAVPVPGDAPAATGPPAPAGESPPPGTFLLTFGHTPVRLTRMAVDPGSDGMTTIAEIGGGTVTLSGRLGTASASTDLRIHAEGVTLGALPGRGVRLGGTARLDGSVTGPRGAEEVRLRVDASDGVIVGWNPLGGVLGTRAPADLRFATLAFEIAGPAGGWTVSGLRGRLEGIDVAAELRIAPDGTVAGAGTADEGGRSVPFTIAGTARAPLIAAR